MFNGDAPSSVRFMRFETSTPSKVADEEPSVSNATPSGQVDEISQTSEPYSYVNLKDTQPNFVRPTEKRAYRMRNRQPAMTHFCPTCNKELKYPSKINEHMRKHTGERPYLCHICGARFSQGHVLKVHLRSHQGERPFKCSFCDRCFVSCSQKNNHEKTHFRAHNMACTSEVDNASENLVDNNIYLCPFEHCGMQSVNREEVEDHIALMHPSDQVWAEEYPVGTDYDSRSAHNHDIGGQYEFYEYTDMHMPHDLGMVMEDETQRTEAVSYDDFNFVENSVPPPTEEVEVETSFHSQAAGSSMQCVKKEDPMGGFQVNYSIPGSSDPHFEEVQIDDAMYDGEEGVRVWLDPQPPKKGRQIDDCDNETLEEVVVDASVLDMAAPKKPYGQKARPRRANKPARNLDWIIDAVAKGHDVDLASPHNRRKPKIHVCEYCGKIDKYPSKILAHMRTHTGEKPFKCEICGMSFAQRTPLRLHVRRHLNQKPYACTFMGCNEEFVSGALLNLHLAKKHFKRRKYVCMKGCGRYFASARNQHHHEQRCYYSREAANSIDEVIYQQLVYEEEESPDDGHYGEQVGPHGVLPEDGALMGVVDEPQFFDQNP